MAGMSLWAAALYCFVQVETFNDGETHMYPNVSTSHPKFHTVNIYYLIHSIQ